MLKVKPEWSADCPGGGETSCESDEGDSLKLILEPIGGREGSGGPTGAADRSDMMRCCFGELEREESDLTS
jgi:hypothetical protein